MSAARAADDPPAAAYRPPSKAS